MTEISSGTEVWRGVANAWECDHLGHLNTKFYVRRLQQAILFLYASLGHDPSVFRGQIVSQHMRFLGEARAGAPLHMEGGILDAGPSDVDLLFILRHSATGQPAASFRLTLENIDQASGQLISWPDDIVAKFADFTVPMTRISEPRSLSLTPGRFEGGFPAEIMQARRVALGAICQADCDMDGYVTSDALMGMVSDAVPHSSSMGWRDVQKETMGEDCKIASVLVEFRFLHAEWARAGDFCEVRSRPDGCTDRAMFTDYWLFDPHQKKVWAKARTAGIAVDLTARKSISLTPEAQKAYSASGD